MDDARNELGDIARLMAGLVRWDLEDDALGYTRASSKADFTESTAGKNPSVSRGAAQSSTSVAAPKVHQSDASNVRILVVEGNPDADLVFVGEGTDGYDPTQQRPFLGPAGELLDKMIQAMGVDRQGVCICTAAQSSASTEPKFEGHTQLHTRLESMRPRVVVALGAFASQALLNTTQSFDSLRGTWHPFLDAQLMPTYHPNDLLRNPASKRAAWADLQKVMAVLGLKK